MWTKRLWLWRFMLCMLLAVSVLAATARADTDVPSESQCRPYIEKALKEKESGDTERESIEKNESSEISVDADTKEDTSAEGDETVNVEDSNENEAPPLEVADEPYVPEASIEVVEGGVDNSQTNEDVTKEETEDDSAEQQIEENKNESNGDSNEEASAEDQTAEKDSGNNSDEKDDAKVDEADEDSETEGDNNESNEADETESKEIDTPKEAEEEIAQTEESSNEASDISQETTQGDDDDDDNNKTEVDDGSQEKAESQEEDEDKTGGEEDSQEVRDEQLSEEELKSNAESIESKEDSKEKEEESVEEVAVTVEESDNKSEEDTNEQNDDDSKESDASQGDKENVDSTSIDGVTEASNEDGTSESETKDAESESEPIEQESETTDNAESEETDESNEQNEASSEEGTPEEDLLKTGEIPENLRPRDHIKQILRLDEEASEAEITIERSADIILRDLKRLYENSIRPLETVYKYRDLSNRHFGDPEIFSKPLVLFMGPWSGGKSSIVNYLTGLEFTEWSLRTGAEPSPAYFNILMHGKDPQVLDGTQLAADWTFSGLQKFGQGLEERLRGLKHPSKILEKVNIVEIPGILEVRKQVSRVFPFNDACQWFIDRADIIFLVYDPSKLDVGPETEAILDQLKGRESQTRIVLNKADTVKPEELMRVQSALIWNISPLMSSAQPPVMYTVSLWSIPYEPSAPVRLLQAQERELLRDLRQAIDKRIENKISSARRFAVRVRNHAKMVDCYLTTYYNHKTIFGNRKLIADAIIENPQNYHIYEGLSTLTNISRYDLPDPETYRDFFRLNQLYDFQQLSATCTYFRGCPITRLDVAIAYDLPELVGKYKKMVETATPQGMPKS
ncbi:uncharacterized protein LOC131846438 [Achroia grisella]|uniref:uncharacterized protein LOC131846438 n=1 Tax=Achroia grisella TaxID=688607 RepID=UPI0027D29429|nr:uncharacterized protein LOC131846438 [Achroia grisella]XP_059051714.1 uncharacterized protein LOC131846438 [Achroia grisella]XP_059051715.1 uncharacterized protein LOC131846438 [Achroia grisella]XP_059051716.1 uncharacterized protein LOC131846438 [Achroia grisella]XP_059051717.1 uncharacterized protein LOC131846438 [Achroia grisella]